MSPKVVAKTVGDAVISEVKSIRANWRTGNIWAVLQSLLVIWVFARPYVDKLVASQVRPQVTEQLAPFTNQVLFCVSELRILETRLDERDVSRSNMWARLGNHETRLQIQESK